MKRRKLRGRAALVARLQGFSFREIGRCMGGVGSEQASNLVGHGLFYNQGTDAEGKRI